MTDPADAAIPGRERILRATIALIADRGYDAVTVTSVANRAGVSRQTVYAAVGPREAVVGYAMQLASSEAIAELQAAVPDTLPAEDYVAELLVVGRRLFRERPVLALLLRPHETNPVFGAGMMDRGRPLVGAWLAGLRSRDDRLAHAAPYGAFVEVVIRLGLSVLLFESEALANDDDLRAFVRGWLGPGLDALSP